MKNAIFYLKYLFTGFTMRYLLVFLLSISISTSYALGFNSVPPRPKPKVDECSTSKFSYCDSSAGRYVMHNGDYSKCYCTKAAVMDLKILEGCCLWQGGVLKKTRQGVVICNNGTISEFCTLQRPNDLMFNWY